MALRSDRAGGKHFVGGWGGWLGGWVVMSSKAKTSSSQTQTYGSNSARGRDGADSAGALAEGVSEHVGGVLYGPRVGRENNCNRLAIVERGDLMLMRELLERIWTGKSKTCQLPHQQRVRLSPW